MPELTERQLEILAAVIKAYTHIPEPVSSKQIAESTDLGVSPATIRNDLVTLEQLGFVRAPHTSAGRVPTEEGYRYFVRYLGSEKRLAPTEMRNIRAAFASSEQDLKRWIRTAAGILARHTDTAALVTEPRSKARTLKHVQLISTHGHLVLMVLVLEGGDVVQQMLTLKEIVSQERLSNVAAYINDVCLGLSSQLIHAKARTTPDALSQDVLELLADVLAEAEQGESFTMVMYGFSDLVPRFGEGIGAKQALRLLDEKSALDDLLNDAIESDDPVKVIIGGGGRNDISELSIVIGKYGTHNLKGAVSVLGPTRMRYGRAISTVRYVATLMSAMMEDIYGESQQN